MVVDVPQGMECVITGALMHRCPYRDESDRGTVTIQWRSGGHGIELHELRLWLDGWGQRTISHEELTQEIANHLAGLVGEVVRVATNWTTADLTVTYTATA